MVLCLMITLCVNLAHSVGGTRRGHVLQVARRTMPDHRPVGISRSDSRMSRCAAAFLFCILRVLNGLRKRARHAHAPRSPSTHAPRHHVTATHLPGGFRLRYPGVPAPATTGPARTGRPRPGRSSDTAGSSATRSRGRICVCVNFKTGPHSNSDSTTALMRARPRGGTLTRLLATGQQAGRR